VKNIALNLFTAIAFPAMIAAGPAAADHPDNPAGGDHPHHRRPPQAAFDACKDKKVNDSCEVTFREHKVTGKCADTPEGTLACRPDRPRRDQPKP
jgi:hypothetical protein